MAGGAWRVVFISTVPPVIEHFVPVFRELGHDPVAVISARRERPRASGRPSVADDTVPAGLDIFIPHHRRAIEGMLRSCDPDLAVCWGYPWRIPAAALAVPRLGSINLHPGLLPRHRGPVPLAWAIRDGDPAFGVTWHRMDAHLDTGPILAQASVPIRDEDVSIMEIAPRLASAAGSLLPRVLERVAAGDPGDAQSEVDATWAGHFEEDYATVDWSRPARAIHDQVRAWAFAFGVGTVVGPIAELDGRRLRLLRTSLTRPEEEAPEITCGDGAPLWILDAEDLP
jgi:methionyl-tRNA formyltransferase